MYKATDYYADVSCATDVNQFFLTPQNSCPPPATCAIDTTNGYPRSSVSCVSNAAAHAQTVFGNDPYLLIPDFRADPTCTREFNVYGVRLLKDRCLRTGVSSSVKYSVRLDWAVDTLTYSTLNCSGSPSQVTRRKSSDVNTNVCIGNTKMFVVQAPFQTPMIYTAYTYYNDSACLSPNRLLFTPVKVESIKDDTDYTACATDVNGLYYSRAPFIDSIETYSGGAFGYDVPFMVEEGFYDATCLLDEAVSVYRSDGTCINIGTFSEKHSFQNGAYNVVRYTDGVCGGVGASSLSLPNTSWNNGACSNLRRFNASQSSIIVTTLASTAMSTSSPGSSKAFTSTSLATPAFNLFNAATATIYKAIDYFSSGDCGLAVNQFFLAPLSSCPLTVTCRAETWNNYVRSSVSCVSDATAHAQAVFGNDPNLMVRHFIDSTCSKEYYVHGLRLLKSQCRRMSASSSIRYSARVDWAVDILNYSSPNCSGDPASVVRRNSSEVSASKCVKGMKIAITQARSPFAVVYTAYTYYDDSTCTQASANRVLFTPAKIENIADDSSYATCVPDDNGLYYSRAPQIKDIAAYSGGALGYDVPYMVEEGFYDATCLLDKLISVYRSDGTCINMGTFSEKHSFQNGAYNVVRYTDGVCGGVGASSLSLPNTSWNNGACSSSRKFNSTAAVAAAMTATPSPTPSAKTPSTPKPAKTAKAPGTKVTTTAKPAKVSTPPKAR